MVSPAGGALLSAYCDGLALLQASVAPGLASLVHGREACFPLVPFGNRVEFNSFPFEGRRIRFEPNTDDPLYLHGDGWLCRWEIADCSDASLTLVLEKQADTGSPYCYRAEQRMTALPDGFTQRLCVTNRAGEAMPFGLGFHPYFPLLRGSRVSFNAQSVWGEREGHLPDQRQGLRPPLDFSTPATVPASFINTCFEGWSGIATLMQPDGTAIRLSASPSLTWLQMYKPDGDAGFLCLEPMSHRPNAFSGDGGCTALLPGQSMCCEISVTLAGV